MLSQNPTPYQLLKAFFTLKMAREIYTKKFKSSSTKGIDRLSGFAFSKQSNSQLKVIHKKCLKGTYKFSPYLELLQSKGREKNPRVLAIPTIRDRIVLHILKEILSRIFPECVPRKLANTYIDEIKVFIRNKPPSEISIFRADIENFYGSINREELTKKLKVKIKSLKLLTLIQRAIETPIVPKGYNRKDIGKYIEICKNRGIPQGLSISNILASIYLHDFDQDMKSISDVVYYRYVDDMLFFADQERISGVKSTTEDKMKALGLVLNEGKTYSKTGNEEFEYLGYRFELPKVTIRASTVENFLHSVAAKFSNYIYDRKNSLKRLKENHYGLEKLKEIFIADLNEKITGAISENRRYGWIFYFNSITDVSVLYRIDNIIGGFFKRLDDFGGIPPSDLKKISKAFYEAKYNPKAGYIHNYNDYETLEKKIEFLKQRGVLSPKRQYSKNKINDLYETLKQRNLSTLQKDDALLY